MQGKLDKVSPKAYRSIQNILHHATNGHIRKTYRDRKVHTGHKKDINKFVKRRSRRAGDHFKKLHTTTQQRVRETIKSHIGKTLMSFSIPVQRNKPRPAAGEDTDSSDTEGEFGSSTEEDGDGNDSPVAGPSTAAD